MTTQLSTKLAVLCVALMLNSAMIGGVAYLFSTKFHQSASVAAFTRGVMLHSITPTI